MLLLWISARDFRQDLQTVVTRGGVNGTRSTTSSSNKAVSIRYEILVCVWYRLLRSSDLLVPTRLYFHANPGLLLAGELHPILRRGSMKKNLFWRRTPGMECWLKPER